MPRTGSRLRTNGERNAPREPLHPTPRRASRLAARQPVVLPDDDDREQHSRTDEVRETEEESHRPQERVVPEEAESLSELRAKRCLIGLALLLEGRAHEEQQHGRDGIGHRMHEERQRPRHAEERASDGRRGDDHHSLPTGDHRDRRGKLLLRDDRAERAGLSGR